jgi:hypothetical protein
MVVTAARPAEVQQLLIRSQLSIHLASDARNDVRHGFHIRLSGVKVDNAGAKYVVAADYSIGDECLTSALTDRPAHG